MEPDTESFQSEFLSYSSVSLMPPDTDQDDHEHRLHCLFRKANHQGGQHEYERHDFHNKSSVNERLTERVTWMAKDVTSALAIVRTADLRMPPEGGRGCIAPRLSSDQRRNGRRHRVFFFSLSPREINKHWRPELRL